MTRIPALLLSTVVLCAPGLPAAAACAPGVLAIEGSDGEGPRAFRVTVADEPHEQAKGLIGVEHLPADEGMLFVFPRSGEVAFWMKDTLIPLDMLFIDAAGRVARIHENAVPLDETSIRSGAAVRYVLEIAGGTSAALGLEAGDRVVSPAVGTGCAAHAPLAGITKEE